MFKLIRVIVYSFALFVCDQTQGQAILVQALPRSLYLDTEVSTNIPLRTNRTDVRCFHLHFEWIGSASNNFEIIFGCDANQNQILDQEEAEMRYGWRMGKYFIEDVHSWNKMETEGSRNASCATFDIRVDYSPTFVPIHFSALCDGVNAFTELTNDPPLELFRPNWNLMRVVRRGVDPSSEWMTYAIKYNTFAIILK